MSYCMALTIYRSSPSVSLQRQKIASFIICVPFGAYDRRDKTMRDPLPRNDTDIPNELSVNIMELSICHRGMQNYFVITIERSYTTKCKAIFTLFQRPLELT